MQVNLIGALNSSSSTSFKSKQEDCPGCNNQSSSMITIPRVVYAALLAAVIGGPLTSCGKNPTGPEVNKYRILKNTFYRIHQLTFTICLPIFSPANKPMKALGAFSSPSIIFSAYFSFFSFSHSDK